MKRTTKVIDIYTLPLDNVQSNYTFPQNSSTSSSFISSQLTPNVVLADTLQTLAPIDIVTYKCQSNGVGTNMTNGSTLPLVKSSNRDEEGGYIPFDHRRVAHPTTDAETLIHLLKGSLGSGILAMPFAFKNAGLWFGLGATLFVGFVCTYCIHVLVKCSHILCKRMKIPSLAFADVAEVAFMSGPMSTRKFSTLARALIDLFLCIDLFGCCCVYIVFVATNIQQVCEVHLGHIDLRLYMLALLPLLLVMNMIRDLKFLAPFSMIANLLIGTGLGITCYYIIYTIYNPPEGLDTFRPAVASISTMPIFFGISIFALEGVGVVMPLENSMKHPNHFIGCPSVLNIGMTVVVSLYTIVGFIGYLAYGDSTEASVTLNLPDDPLAQSVKTMIAVAIFFTYMLQFYVPMEIVWKLFKHRFTAHPLTAEYSFRIFLVTATVVIAVAVPNLGPFISLVGAVCLSTLGLMFPAIIELVTYWEEEGMGTCYWRLWKNVFIILFGVLGFVTGTIVSLDDIIKEFGKVH